MLHITNGSAVSLADTGIGGEIVCWLDVLHEGPVPAGLDLDDLTRLRACFLSDEWSQHQPSLVERDAALRGFAAHQDVTLWFEHDLYDQLQLIQILDWFHGRNTGSTRLTLICIDEFPGVDPFHGLGQLTGAQLATLWPRRRAVSSRELEVAALAWRAFRSPDPMEIEVFLRRQVSELPFLNAALFRHLQEFPATQNGLGRLQRQILELVNEGVRSLPALFAANARREESVYLGDCTFGQYVSGLMKCRHPLLEHPDKEFRLTQVGRDILAGRSDHVRLNGINRWLGGVHLDGFEVLWRWDESRRSLVAY